MFNILSTLSNEMTISYLFLYSIKFYQNVNPFFH